MITMESRVVAGPDQVSVDLNEESVILHAPSGAYYGLDEVGQRIWQLLQTPTDAGAIHEVILSEFEVEADECARDLLAFLSDLEREGLIGVDDSGAP
jgi:hypothetical protein